MVFEQCSPAGLVLYMSLFADISNQIDRLRAAIDLLVTRCAIAGGIVCFAVKDFTSVAWAQDVVIRGERIAKFGTEFI